MNDPEIRSDDPYEAKAEVLRRQLIEELDRQGLLEANGWRRAVWAARRHWFVPGFYAQDNSDSGLTRWRPVTADTAPEAWLEAVYSDMTLVTQFDGEETDWGNPQPRVGGEPTSSSTLPSLVLRMWQDADLRPGQAVLLVGTGTGYSTALAEEYLGEDGYVASVEVDPYRLEQAARALYGNGYSPTLATADGLYGYWPAAPYDRVVTMCSVRTIPHAWLAQTRPGGKILTTLSGWMYGYSRALITVTGNSHDNRDSEGGEQVRAEGHLLPGTISFMAARQHARPAAGNPSDWERLMTRQEARPAQFDPTRLEEGTAEGFHGRFLAQLSAPNAQLVWDGEVLYLPDVVTGSVTSLTPRDPGWEVRSYGPHDSWTAIERTWSAWDQAGRPGPETFRVTVGEGHQTITHNSCMELSFTLPITVP